MLRARLLELGIFGVAGLLLAISVLLGIQYSAWIGVFFFILANTALMAFIYNDRRLMPGLMKSDVPFVLCRTGFVGRCRQMLRWLPTEPRCHFCLVPFGGIGKLMGIKASSQSPNFCRMCFETFPAQTYEMQTGILFADIRGFTAWSETQGAADAVATVNRFYAIANRVLSKDDAIVNYVGDQVMAIYPEMMPSVGDHAAQIMLDAARRLVAAVRQAEDALPVGVGINIGMAQMGNVEMGGAKGFTAIGDTVNTAARLQANAGEYEIVYSQSAYEALDEPPEDAKKISLDLKGKSEKQTAYVIQDMQGGA